MKQIRITCEGAKAVKYSDLIPLQGNLKDLSKENYGRLKKQIIDLGFSEPISVWLHKKKMNILNGHQRLRVISTMVEKEGYQCDPLPISLISAKDMNEAKRKVLALTSQYGEIKEEGLYEFLTGTDIDPTTLIDDYRFPEVDLPSFVDGYFSKTDAEKEEVEDVVPEVKEETNVKLGDIYLFGAYYKCESCGKEYDYEQGKKMKECPCG